MTNTEGRKMKNDTKVTVRKAQTLPLGAKWTCQASYRVAVDGRIVGDVQKHQNYGSVARWVAKPSPIARKGRMVATFDTLTAAAAYLAN